MALPSTCDEKRLEENPVVRLYEVRKQRVHLRAEFRVELFKLWKDGKIDEMKELLDKHDLGIDQVGKEFINRLIAGFYQNGYPLHRRCEIEEIPDYEEKNPLVVSGVFSRRDGIKEGIKLDPEFKKKIFENYPQVSVEDAFINAGINPIDVGYQRIKVIKKSFDRNLEEEYDDSPVEATSDETDIAEITDEIVVQGHPYVAYFMKGEPRLSNEFFNETYLLVHVSLDEIFEAYELKGLIFDTKARVMIRATQLRWTPKNISDTKWSDRVITIQNNRRRLMEKAIKSWFTKIRDIYPTLPIDDRKRLCRWISELPVDMRRVYTTKYILELIGIPKSTYYQILNNEHYGESRKIKALQDDKDIKLVCSTMDYRGFAKGVRQIYMLMPLVTGRSFSINKIRRLMRKYGIRTHIRRPSRSRKAMKELIEKNKKANILLRRFRLHRPDEVRLVDVTYIDYGNELRAYGSASIDPATGKLICFVISENNDLELALKTLEEMDKVPAKPGAILHSDQGIVYFADDFQASVAERDLDQSMSRRGNCWDNAPQEAFFGHFKDESGYEKCTTLEELRDKAAEYMLYYNTERKIWERGRMTPVEYEAYLNAMSDDEFADYIAKEEIKYEKTKEESAKKAIKRAKEYHDDTLAALEERDETGKKRG